MLAVCHLWMMTIICPRQGKENIQCHKFLFLCACVSSYSTSPKLNMDIAQSPASVSNERPEDSQAALLSVQNALQSKGPAANLNRRQTRGRRDVRQSTLNMASNDDLPLSRVVDAG